MAEETFERAQEGLRLAAANLHALAKSHGGPHLAALHDIVGEVLAVSECGEWQEGTWEAEPGAWADFGRQLDRAAGVRAGRVTLEEWAQVRAERNGTLLESLLQAVQAAGGETKMIPGLVHATLHYEHGRCLVCGEPVNWSEPIYRVSGGYPFYACPAGHWMTMKVSEDGEQSFGAGTLFMAYLPDPPRPGTLPSAEDVVEEPAR